MPIGGKQRNDGVLTTGNRAIATGKQDDDHR